MQAILSSLPWQLLHVLFYVPLFPANLLAFGDLPALMEARTMRFLSTTSVLSSLTNVCISASGGAFPFGSSGLFLCGEFWAEELCELSHLLLVVCYSFSLDALVLVRLSLLSSFL